MTPEQTPQVIVLHETVAQSWLKDAGSVALALVMISIGWALDSSAMEWVGFVLFCLMMIARASGAATRLTPQQAADMLAAEFGVRAHD